MRTIISIDVLRHKLAYDNVLGVLIWKMSPSNNVNVGRVAGYIRTDGYRMLTINGVITYAHHAIWRINKGEIPAGYKIDHINGVRSDNRMSNLRLVTHQQNAKNQKRKITNTSGVTGVYFNRERTRWIANICVDGRTKYLGIFTSIIDAIAERKRAEKEFGFHENHGRSQRTDAGER